MLTTFDNPHSPFDDYDRWRGYDQTMGHHSAELLARVVVTSDELSEADQAFAIEKAIDEIISNDGELKYKKVTRTI